MLFELRMRFDGNEGDEMDVIDLIDTFEWLIQNNTSVKVRPSELRIMNGNHLCEGRKHAVSD